MGPGDLCSSGPGWDKLDLQVENQPRAAYIGSISEVMSKWDNVQVEHFYGQEGGNSD